MTELTFLIELFLNHDLPKDTKQAIAERIKEVEQGLTTSPAIRPVKAQIHALPAHMDEGAVPLVPQTSVAALALGQRESTMNAAMNHKRPMDPNTGRPRKF